MRTLRTRLPSEGQSCCPRALGTFQHRKRRPTDMSVVPENLRKQVNVDRPLEDLPRNFTLERAPNDQEWSRSGCGAFGKGSCRICSVQILRANVFADRNGEPSSVQPRRYAGSARRPDWTVDNWSSRSTLADVDSSAGLSTEMLDSLTNGDPWWNYNEVCP